MGEKSVITVFIYRPQQENYVLYIGSTVQLVLSLISTIPLSKLDTSEIWIVNMESSTIKRKKNLIIVQKKKIKLPRLRTQGTRKQGCKASIHIREYIIYPDYSIKDGVANTLSKWKLRILKEENLKLLRGDIEKGLAKSVRKYYVSLPTAQAHHSIHPTGGIFGMAQKVHPKLVEKIHQLVSEGVISVRM